jgi:hypothetical protein
MLGWIVVVLSLWQSGRVRQRAHGRERGAA